MRTIGFACLIFASTGLAVSATQNSWIDGSGDYGPVSGWGEAYWYGSGVASVPGTGALTLGREVANPECNFIASLSPWPKHAALADLNGDGHLDVISCNAWGQMIVSLNTDGTGENWESQVIDVTYGTDSKSVFPADVDNDGDIDVLYGNRWESCCMENSNGLGTLWERHHIDDHEYLNKVMGFDYDDDGDVDAVVLSQSPSQIQLYTNNAGSADSWEFDQAVSGMHDPRWYQIGDMNGDGKQDLCYGGRNKSGQTSMTGWIENRYPEPWVNNGMSPYRPSWGAVIHDWDCDGDLDIMMPVFFSSLDRTFLRLFLNTDGLGLEWDVVTIQIIDTGGAGLVEVLDFDSDGDMDILGYYAWRKEEVFLLENVCGYDQPYVMHTLFKSNGYCFPYSTGDFNEDGFQDLLFIQWESEPGSVEWMHFIQEAEIGSAESSVLYLGNDPGWDQFNWNSSNPSGSQTAFQVRSSDDFEDMGLWSDTLFSPGSLQGVLEENDSYFQYRTILSAGSGESPLLEDVTLTWNPLGLSEGNEGSAINLVPLQNPSQGATAITFTLPERGMITLQVFDLAGRLENSISVICNQGVNEHVFQELPAGVHFCRLSCADGECTVKLLVN